MKVLFLDIDGVLNSTRTCVAFGGFPMQLDHIAAFDQVAIRLLQRVCDNTGAKVVLSSAWRLHCNFADAGRAFGLPIIDRTDNGMGPRGSQIQRWLDARDDIEAYAIIDDDSDMLPQQLASFVKTNAEDGVTWSSFKALCRILGADPYEGQPRNRNWQQGGQQLDWSDQ
ncbi:HAD domain-containing protein [Rhizobacter sp. OV335]|jgi:hypothetical protein|uniref:HAD domain-containing protein n=1 Tax=Rhizobacter sp. OV335 TaxID=1500264 RepID=UPI0009143D51|nr:HAD domain-containing protein [Rhizobacter sp. OV335]SHN40290.1 hypothetical protein SAMN02787076_06202 [Rhizobacter sp. OV335]